MSAAPDRPLDPRIVAKLRRDRLSLHVEQAYRAAVDHRNQTGVTDRLVACLRQWNGEYSPSELAKLTQQNLPTDLFFNVSRVKARALAAVIGDYLNSVALDPFDVLPTPVPTLPEGPARAVAGQESARRARELGVRDEEALTWIGHQVERESIEAMNRLAAERAQRVRLRLLDALEESDFWAVRDRMIEYLTIFPTAFLCGPERRIRMQEAWEDGALKARPTLVLTWDAPHPMDLFPGPNNRSLQDGYVCERVYLTPAQLDAMRGQPGWNSEAIDEALTLYEQMQRPIETPGTDTSQWERARIELHDPSLRSGAPEAAIEAVKYWGPASGRMLKEWGIDDVPDHQWREIAAVWAMGTVVMAMLNPDPLGWRPYYGTSWVRMPGSVWGVSPMETIADCQRCINASIRSLVNAMAFSSGIQIAVDLDAMDRDHVPERSIAPFHVHFYRGSLSPSGRKPIEFWTMDGRVQEKLAVLEYFERQADERIVPRYMYGSTDVGSAGMTASGLAQLRGDVRMGIKHVLASIDRDIMRPALQALYRTLATEAAEPWFMGGDVRIVPRGAMAMMVREQTILRQMEVLNLATARPDVRQVLRGPEGLEGLRDLIESITRSLNLPVSIVKSHEELTRLIETLEWQQAAAMTAREGQPPPPRPSSTIGPQEAEATRTVDQELGERAGRQLRGQLATTPTRPVESSS